MKRDLHILHLGEANSTKLSMRFLQRGQVEFEVIERADEASI